MNGWSTDAVRELTPGSVQVMARSSSATGVDVGGTKVLAGEVSDDGVVVATVRRSTPHRSVSPAVVEDTIVAAVEQLAQRTGTTPRAVGVGAAGFVDADGTVAFSPHLSWRNEPLQARLMDRLDVPVLVDN